MLLCEREGEREREGGREGGRERGRERGREGGREGGKEREREKLYSYTASVVTSRAMQLLEPRLVAHKSTDCASHCRCGQSHLNL